MKLSIKQGLKILLSVGSLSVLLANAGLDKTLEELSTANLWYLPVCVAIYLLSQFVSAYRWKFLSSPLGFHLSLREFYDYYMMGMFLNLFLPGAIGGDVGRVYYLAKSRDRKKREALLTLLAERGVGLAALMVLTSLACLLPVTRVIPGAIRWPLLLGSLLGLIVFVAIRFVPIQSLSTRYPKLALLIQARVYWQDLSLLARSLSISIGVHAFMVLVHWMITQALDLEVPVVFLAATYGVVALASVLPTSFNGIGVREGAYIYMLSLLHVPQHSGLAFGVYWFLISSITSLLGGLVFIKGHYKTPTLQEVRLD